MKKYFLILSFLLTSTLFAQQWATVTEGFTSDVWSIDWLNSSVVWASATTSSSSATQVGKSIDGGATWTMVTNVPQGGGYGIAVLDANTAVVSTGPPSGDGRIYRTTDGGTTWTQVYTASGAWFNFVDNVSATELWAQSDPIGGVFHIVKSTDAGATWALIANPPAQPASNVFGANGSFYRIGTYCWFGCGGSSTASTNRVYKSSTGPDGPWTFGTTPNAYTGTIAFSSGTGAGVAGYWSQTTTIGRTADGGATWTAQTTATGTVNGLDYVRGTNYVWSATSTGIWQSSDNGATWTANTLGATAAMNVVRFYGDANVGLAGGVGGVLLKSTLAPVVPVELTSFTAASVDGKVVLNWTTATEVNNRGFEIERSNNNVDFNVIGFVNGNGTTTETMNYAFTDNGVAQGSYYYRLRQIDFNGQSEYSDVVEVNVTAPAVFALDQNYPNPFNPSTRIHYSVAVPGNVKLAVYNLLGQEVATLVNGFMEAGQYDITFDAQDMPSGTYIYKIETSQFSQARKMLLTK